LVALPPTFGFIGFGHIGANEERTKPLRVEFLFQLAPSFYIAIDNGHLG